MNRFWERVLLAVVVCVPVPALALSGLNVPLPSVVERVAAALVPFATAATLEEDATLAAGTIVHAPGGPKARVAHTSPATNPVAAARVTRRANAKTQAPSSSRARKKAGHILPTSSGPSSTFGEETVPTEPASPAPRPTPTASTPPADTKPPTRTTEPNVRPEPDDKADPIPTVEPDVKPPPDETVDTPSKPDVKPSDPPAPNDPPARDEKPVERDSAGT